MDIKQRASKIFTWKITYRIIRDETLLCAKRVLQLVTSARISQRDPKMERNIEL